MTDVRDASMSGQTSDGRSVARPMSPHLQVYKPQLTSVLSIFHRITGVALSAGTLLLVWWLVAAASSDAAYATVSRFMRSPVGYLVLFGWTVALWYHFCAGLRHLLWDAGYGYELPQVHRSGWLALAATLVLTLATWAVLVLR